MPRKGGTAPKEGVNARHFCCGCITFLSAVLLLQVCVLANLLRKLTDVHQVPTSAPVQGVSAASPSIRGTAVASDSVSAVGSPAEDANLALGIAFGVGSDAALMFILSLLQNSPKCDVVIICDQLLTKEEMETAGIDTSRVRFEVGLSQTAPWNAFPSSTQRYWLLKEYLKALPSERYRFVLVSDVSDVVFQADPFVWATHQPQGLHVFEDESATVGTDTATMQSMVQCFGDSAANKIKEQKLVPTGFVMGTPKEVQLYVESVAEQIEAHVICQTDGVDGAIHNAVIRSSVLASSLNVHVHENQRGPVWTGANVPGGSINLDNANFIINQDGYRYAVLHNYDKHDGLWRLMTQRFLGERKSKQSAVLDCSSFDVAGGDLLGYDLTHAPASTEKDCCIACLGDTGCGSFVFGPSVQHCWLKRQGANERVEKPGSDLRSGILKSR
eukprot:CAMPEP_0169067624 /NCGR_PEP_ID=MMETSP1015-20121227/3589_1 /TAXON_ID=342587 /ORGANISM="Karlodinium micrum, Strain CCMP2283" /LENGTH=442 /DNA_ID=CAMNT_0009126383 /DNA_START=45 /DNA_END=1373 /DNA_ORIENTATION=-